MSDGSAAATFDLVADTAEQVAADQQQVADDARSAARRARRSGRWSDLAGSGLPQALIARLAAGAAGLGRAASLLRIATISGLAGEGLSRRRIGRHLAISHQRVTSLLRRGG